MASSGGCIKSLRDDMGGTRLSFQMQRLILIETGYRTGIVFHPDDTLAVIAALTRATHVKVAGESAVSEVNNLEPIAVNFINPEVLNPSSSDPNNPEPIKADTNPFQ